MKGQIEKYLNEPVILSSTKFISSILIGWLKNKHIIYSLSDKRKVTFPKGNSFQNSSEKTPCIYFLI